MVREKDFLIERMIRILGDLASDENMRGTIPESVGKVLVRKGCIAGGFLVAGGFIAGPIGLAVVGAFGSLVAFCEGVEPIPVSDLIYDMPYHQREKLFDQIVNIMARNQISNITALKATLEAGGVVRNEVIRELQSFVKNELPYVLV